LTRARPLGRLAPLVIALPVALLALSSSVMSSSAASPIKLGLSPIGASGSNFVLTMQPGESRDLSVELVNRGGESVLTRSFAADAYSMVNGGFAVRLDTEPTSGTTGWLNYAGADLDLAPGAVVDRQFTVAVPAATPPGEYLTSVVLQNADAMASESTTENSVVLKQIVRQVVAVSIEVPGPRTPALELGPVTQTIVADHSSVAVGVHNVGNVRLHPSGEFVLWDSSGAELTRFPLKMDTVYAHTDTTAEIPFAQRLNPGAYTAELDLTDPSGLAVSSNKLPMIIPEVAIAPTPQTNTAPAPVAQTNQTPVASTVAAAAAMDPMMLVLIAFGAGLGLMLAAGGIGFTIYRRRKRRAA
jgi:hypothetical protein